VTNFLNS